MLTVDALWNSKDTYNWVPASTAVVGIWPFGLITNRMEWVGPMGVVFFEAIELEQEGRNLFWTWKVS